jgi:hypothetical protein
MKQVYLPQIIVNSGGDQDGHEGPGQMNEVRLTTVRACRPALAFPSKVMGATNLSRRGRNLPT